MHLANRMSFCEVPGVSIAVIDESRIGLGSWLRVCGHRWQVACHTEDPLPGGLH